MGGSCDRYKISDKKLYLVKKWFFRINEFHLHLILFGFKYLQRFVRIFDVLFGKVWV